MENGDERAARTPDSDPAVTPEQRKKATLRDLAQYRVGQKAYWIVFRSDGRPDFQRSENWMRDEHPWILWRRKVLPWDVSMRPPRAHPGDTMIIMMLCNQKPKIEPFQIMDVERSMNSGEFFYTGPRGMRMPEGLLFPSKKAARKEIARMARMFAAWTAAWEDGAQEKKA